MAGLSQGAGGLSQEGNGAGPRTRIINLAKTNMTQADQISFRILWQAEQQELTMVHNLVKVYLQNRNFPMYRCGTGCYPKTGAFTAGANFGVGPTGVTSPTLVDFPNPM